MVATQNNENLGPAERIIQSLLTFTDHCVHNRLGAVIQDRRFHIGVRWEPITYKAEGAVKTVYKVTKVGRKSIKTKIGTLREADKKIMADDGRSVVGEFRDAGLYPEVVTWFYHQIADVWKLDNEFAARWASYAFAQEHKDLKVILAAFMLVQSRKGDAVTVAGSTLFDEDYRDIGEAMMLLRRKDGNDLNPKLLLRIHKVLTLPTVAAINRELGFGQSTREAFLGRWPKVVKKWLGQLEANPKLFEGLVKKGFRSTIKKLATVSGYKPESENFFEIMRWKQKQSAAGHRTLVIGKELAKVETWDGLTEEQICGRIVAEKLNYKVIAPKVPKSIGITRAIMAAAIESGGLSDRDLIIYTPTLEDLNLLDVPAIKIRWEKAMKEADDMRAANIAKNVQRKDVKEKLQEAADTAMKKAVEEVTRNLRIYVIIDISGSMTQSITKAKEYIAKFLQGFPLDRMHVVVFNTIGRVVEIKEASAVGVELAFRGFSASGGTSHREAIAALANHKPKVDEDSIFLFVGDEGETGSFASAVRSSGLRPTAFGLIKLPSSDAKIIVQTTAKELGVPCFLVDENTFSDVYAIPRTIKALVSSTPVAAPIGSAPAPIRISLVETILKTELLKKPTWA